MKKYIRRHFFLILGLACSIVGYAQKAETQVYKETIKTVQLHPNGKEQGFPVLYLDRAGTLQLSFDDLSEDVATYSYTFVHCDANWQESDLYPSDYLDGFPENPIDEYDYSFNTTTPYIHYQLEFPNTNVRFYYPGNYMLKVFENYDQEQLVFTKRFVVVEKLTSNQLKVDKQGGIALMGNQHRLELETRLDANWLDPSRIRVVLLKNQNWHQQVVVKHPDQYVGNKLVYSNSNTMVFKAGNEFRAFNTKSVQYPGVRTQQLSFIDQTYQFLLTPDRDRTYKDYIYQEDLNGNYQVDTEISENEALEADYVRVYFTVPMNAPVKGDSLFLVGAFNHWKMNAESLLRYNYSDKAYQLSLLLKQGYYNYQYVLKRIEGGYDFQFLSGNFSATENNYTAILYYHDQRDGFDRIIGFTEVQSSN